MSFNSNYVSISSNKIANDEDLRWDHYEKIQEHRGVFSKDRDRILYAKSFLRLRGKTQVFMLQKNDYIRTRLTHSLEVNQLAKSIASALGQNIDLVEAIALGHDVGHTPFGHIGERTIAELLKNDGVTLDAERGFKHNLQALRLLCDLEKGADYPQTKGLNLTKYTLWGISHHSSLKLQDNPFYDNYINAIKAYWSFEGFIVALADEIAQRHHDIEDSLRYRIIDRKKLLDEIGKFNRLFGNVEKSCYKRLEAELTTLDEPVFNSLFARLVVNMYVSNIIKQSKDKLRMLCERYRISNQQDFINVKANIPSDEYKDCISMTPELKQLDEDFQKFLKTNVLSSYQAQAMDGKAAYIIKKLFDAFRDTPEQLPDTAICSFSIFAGIGLPYCREQALGAIQGNEKILHRCIADYIGGMTDQFAYDEFDRLYGTRI